MTHVFSYGSFVMNTEEQIRQCIQARSGEVIAAFLETAANLAALFPLSPKLPDHYPQTAIFIPWSILDSRRKFRHDSKKTELADKGGVDHGDTAPACFFVLCSTSPV
jgi:hypothetical protein